VEVQVLSHPPPKFKKVVMAIRPVCDNCKKELKEFGAILLSPPKNGLVVKYHLCGACYKKVTDTFDPKPGRTL
jgi:hypothetical protein